MKTTSMRARTLACALLVTTAYCGLSAQPAAAQTAPTFRNLDANGVDLVQGDFVRAFAEGSIGAGEAELVLLRLVGNVGPRGGSQRDNIYMSASSNGDRFVAFGTRQEKFPGAEARGATLTGSGSSYVYRAPDGTQIEFGLGGAETGKISNLCLDGAEQSFCNLIPTSIISPDGKTVTLEHEFWNNCLEQQSPEDPLDCTSYWRISRISNSFGYSIAFDYAAGPGTGHSNPPAGFYERTDAQFYNSGAGSSSLASVSYAYPSAGVTEITDQAGDVWRVTSTGALYAIRRPGASADTISATRSSTTGLVTQVTDAGMTTSYSRSVNGTTATMTVTQVDPNGPDPVTTVVSSLTTGRTISVTDPLSRTTDFQYDSNGRLTRVTQPEDNYIAYAYDDRGNVTEARMRDKSGNSANDIVTSADYPDSCANPLTCNSPESATDARGNVTEYTYDPDHGGVLTVTGPPPTPNAVRPQSRYAYTLISGEYRVTGISRCQTGSAPACVGTADEAKTTIAYNADGTVASTTSGDGSGTLSVTSTMTYDDVGSLIAVDGPLSGTDDTTRFHYDSGRRLEWTVSPDPDPGQGPGGTSGPLKHRAVRNDYENGLLAKVEIGNVDDPSAPEWDSSSPAQEMQTEYENARPVKRKLVSGGTVYALTQMSYDGLGRPDCVVQRMDLNDFGSSLPGACTLTTPDGAHGPDRIVKTLYDSAGQVTQVKTALGVTGVTADEATMTYTDNGLVATLLDAESNKTSYVYDDHDRLSQTRYPSATKGAGTSNSSDYQLVGYDAAGNVTSLRNRANETIAFGYDALDRLTSKNMPGSELDISYGYDLLGQMTSAATSAQTLSFAYDALSRNLSQTDGTRVYSSQYDLAGNRTRLTHPDGFYVDQDFLVTGEMTKIRENGATSGVGVLATYGYDDLGRRTSLTFGNGETTSYNYDAVSRLSQLGHDLSGSATTNDLTLTFSYNPASQIVSTLRSNDLYAWAGHGSGSTSTTSNGLNQIGSWNGTLTYDAKGNMTSDGTNAYSYDSENRLKPPFPYYYDPLGRLAGAGSPIAIHYENYVDGLIAEKSPSNSNITYRHVFGPGTDEPIVWYNGSGTSDRRFLHADERGSIAAVTDNSANLLAINRYDEYGKTETSNSSYMGRFLYTGQRYFGGFGLYYYKNRFYHPGAGGRFMQPDPIGYGGGMNLYAYVGGDPVNFTDPWGLDEGDIEVCYGVWFNGACVSRGFLRRLLDNLLLNTANSFLHVGPSSGGVTTAPSRPDPCPGAKAPTPNRFPLFNAPDEITEWDRRNPPPGSVTVTALDGTAFFAPAWADFKQAYSDATRTYTLIGLNTAVGHWGQYDFQRSGNTFTGAYSNASNYVVGIYLNGMGYSRKDAIALANAFATKFSSNAGSPLQRDWWTRGWNTAQSGACKR